MHPNAHLERMIARETYARMIASLSPKQLATAALLLEDLAPIDAAELLGINNHTVHVRMGRARARLLERFPHVRSLVAPAPDPSGGDS